MMRWISILMAAIVIAACFFPWVIVESRHLTIGGFYSDVEDLGKPGIIHSLLCSLFILFLLIFKTWSVRIAFILSTINIAWAARNFILVTACGRGECPAKQPALYFLIAGSVLMMITVLLIKMDTTENTVQ